MTTLTSITTATPDGDFHIIVDDHDVAHASGFGLLVELVRRLPEPWRDMPVKPVAVHPYQRLVEAYFAGDRTALDRIPRSQPGTNFQQNVWQAMSRIPYGQTISYRELAAAGNPSAIRAAGTTCGLNRLALLVPCHRIVKSDGGVGSYLYGAAIKGSLLDHEACG